MNQMDVEDECWFLRHNNVICKPSLILASRYPSFLRAISNERTHIFSLESIRLTILLNTGDPTVGMSVGFCAIIMDI